MLRAAHLASSTVIAPGRLADCQAEHPRGGITHAPDSPLRQVPRFAARPVNPEDQGDGA